MKTNRATSATCALLSLSINKQQPATSRLQAMLGNVNSSKPRLPNLSMVQTAGHANAKFVSPKPHESRRESVSLKPAVLKIVAL